MNWKLFITACVSGALISFPQNIIGCGGETDPYDYYISFFNQHISSNKTYKPFYYTNSYFLYDTEEPTPVSTVLAKEWSAYCGSGVTEKDAIQFVNKYALKDVTSLYYAIDKKTPLKIPDSVKRNSMTNYFIKSKDAEALGYIMYAKQVEPYVYAESEWEGPKKDEAKIAKLIKNGNQLYTAAKKDVFKLKYAYQILRLNHYSGNYANTIVEYENLVATNTTKSVLQPLCLALKAGALFKTGNKKLAAYLFSKAYAMSDAKKISNYLGFTWSIKKEDDETQYLAQCKTDEEKATMLTLFSLNTVNNDVATVTEIFKLNPSNDALEVLAVREINKLEERLLTPTLQQEKGIKQIYINYSSTNVDSVMQLAKKDALQLTTLLHNISESKATANKALFETGAAYTSFMLRDFAMAKKYLATAKQLNPSSKVSDQWALTNLLITINEKDKIDAAFEEQILPSVQWLLQKAKNDPVLKTSNSWSDISPWKQFYRNLFNNILAPRYNKQGDVYKEALAYGTADNTYGSNYVMGSTSGIDFLRNKLTVTDVEKLYSLLSGKPNKFEQFVINNNMIKLNTVVDFAGTAYLREGNYTKAIEWLKKSANSSPLNKNPFVDLLYDLEEQLPTEKKFTTSKLVFAQEMLRLQGLVKTDKANAAKHLYKIALGLYNTTHYGHTWEIVQYGRSGSDGYYMPDNATTFEKEYYGCYAAHHTFKAALEASSDKEFKARCLFMMGKCSQKTVQQPQFHQFPNNWDAFDKALSNYLPTFKNNTYFPQFVKEYKDTKFYTEAFNSCSYLRDFVNKK
jgi:tetratricopeptide (TPR) repeat protein